MHMKALLFVVLVILQLTHCVVLNVEHHKVQRNFISVPKVGGGKGVFPLQGNLDQYAEFFVNISIGTPPLSLRVQIDTGSSDLNFYGTGCKGCPQMANLTYYNIKNSKTGKMIECDDSDYNCYKGSASEGGSDEACYDGSFCDFQIEYGGGGEITGYAATDEFSIGDTSLVVDFGVIEYLNGPFENPGIDGVWGFAYDKLSSFGGVSVMQRIALQFKTYDSFSLCLIPDAAVMDIGTNYHSDTSIQWTPIVQTEWYGVNMLDFQINNVSIGVSHGDLNDNGVIVDSGTTLYIVNKKMLEAIEKIMTGMCSKTNLTGICGAPSGKSLFDGYCFEMTDDEVAVFPTIATPLQGLKDPLFLEPTDYLWQGTGEAGYYCMGISYIGDGLPVILGDIVLQKYHTVFDRKTSQIGFGPLSSCPARV